MQSYLQYRRISLAVKREIQQQADVVASMSAPREDQGPSEPSQIHDHEKVSGPDRRFLEQQNLNTVSHSDGSHSSTAVPDARAVVTNVATSMSMSQRISQQPNPVSLTNNQDQAFLVDWDGPDDPEKPRNWSIARRVTCTLQISIIATALGCAAGIDAAILPQAADDFGVSDVAESLATGMYLIGQGVGCLVAGPFSEIFGRNIVYTGSMIVFMFWVMACGLTPNFGGQITFRFLAGCAASAPLTCCGGSVSDMFDALEKTWGFPLYAIASFGGPMLGAVMGAYIGPSPIVTWRWAEWTMLIISGLVIVSILLLMPETYGVILLKWKAERYRIETGNDRYYSEHDTANATLFSRLKVSMTRPFTMLTEPIILAVTLYLTLVYIVLFTFLVGWPYIFEYTYNIGQGLGNVIFIAMFMGLQLTYFLIPLVYSITNKKIKFAISQGGNHFNPEIRLWYGMLGSSVAIPISLFWIGATSTSNITIWSPIIAVSLFGYGVMGVYICSYMYVIDSYESYSASALTFVSFTRYVCAGGVTVAGIPLYESLGTDHMLYLLGGIACLLAPIPFVFFKWGYLLRKNSKYAVF